MFEPTKQPWLPLGSLLIREGLITSEQLEEALLLQQGTGRRLGELLVDWGWVSSRAICIALAEQYELEYVEIDEVELDREVASRLPRQLARAHQALPLRRLPDGRVLVGVADPTDVGAADELRSVLGAIRLAVVDQIGLERAIHEAYAASAA
jgi:MSHA biogenesis protein MshE